MSKQAAREGYNPFFTIDDLPLSDDQKEMVLEWFARKIIRLDPDPIGKSYDPLVIDGITAHSYLFDLNDGGRHHTAWDSLAHLEELLVVEMQDLARDYE